MITAITIENFKGISEPVTIDFKPITLLFGANSAGKSTVFHALYYLHNILTEVGNKSDKVIYYDYGDFISMVNNNDPKKDISITLTCKISTAGDDHFLSLHGMLLDLLWASEDNKQATEIIADICEHQYQHPEVKIKISLGMIDEYDSKNPVIKLIEVDFMQSKICIDYKASNITMSNPDKLLIYTPIKSSTVHNQMGSPSQRRFLSRPLCVDRQRRCARRLGSGSWKTGRNHRCQFAG